LFHIRDTIEFLLGCLQGISYYAVGSYAITRLSPKALQIQDILAGIAEAIDGEIERFVVEQIRMMGKDPALLKPTTIDVQQRNPSVWFSQQPLSTNPN